MRFHDRIPTEIYFGEGELQRLPSLVEESSPCLILASERINARILPGRQALRITETMPDPDTALVRRLAEKLQKFRRGVMIAAGGGSTIDLAKALRHSLPESAINLIAVPTTSGTGSEVTPYAILTGEDRLKTVLAGPSLFPDIALCDPLLTSSMPRQLTIDTGIDALSHAMEGLFAERCRDRLADLAFTACRRIGRALPGTLADPTDSGARSEMMLSSTEAGIVLANCGTVAVHALGYHLTRAFGYTHGFANALLLAAFVERMASKGSPEAAEIQRIFPGGIRTFLRQTGVPESVPDRMTDSFAEEAAVAVWQAGGWKKSTIPLTIEDLKLILKGEN